MTWCVLPLLVNMPDRKDAQLVRLQVPCWQLRKALPRCLGHAATDKKGFRRLALRDWTSARLKIPVANCRITKQEHLSYRLCLSILVVCCSVDSSPGDEPHSSGNMGPFS